MDLPVVVAGEHKGSNQQIDASRQFVFVCQVIISRTRTWAVLQCRELMQLLASPGSRQPDSPAHRRDSPGNNCTHGLGWNGKWDR